MLIPGAHPGHPIVEARKVIPGSILKFNRRKLETESNPSNETRCHGSGDLG
jgi:hypothetical protein